MPESRGKAPRRKSVDRELLLVDGREPNVLVRYHDGIGGEFFYQKRAPSSRPPWIDVV